MTALYALAGLVFVTQRYDLVGLGVFGYFTGNCCALYRRGTHGELSSDRCHQHPVERDIRSNVAWESLDVDRIAFANSVLLAAGVNNCVICSHSYAVRSLPNLSILSTGNRHGQFQFEGISPALIDNKAIRT